MHGQGSALVSSPLGLCLFTVAAYVSLGLSNSLSQETYAPSLPNIFIFMVSPHPHHTCTVNAHTILAPHMMINKQLRFLNSLQFAKVSPPNSQSYQFAKVFPRHHFALYTISSKIVTNA